ncbi:MAG: hypothetical protein U0231_03355 [Nitrospiraceae bacterium]
MRFEAQYGNGQDVFKGLDDQVQESAEATVWLARVSTLHGRAWGQLLDLADLSATAVER